MTAVLVWSFAVILQIVTTIESIPLLLLKRLAIITSPVGSLSYSNAKLAFHTNHTGVTSVPPCCSDVIGSLTCKRLHDRDPLAFQRRCNNEADFSLIQCCKMCGMDEAPQRYERFFEAELDSEHCFDRRSSEFCQRFLKKNDFWSGSIWSCDGINANLAFRICRRTCGFCRKDLYLTDEGYYLPTPCGQMPEFVPYSKKMFQKIF
uniref:ShKT domain-containing protein n=1 Tax=Syphacia muris TaxID=451379 RepID=A0A0N5AIU8_9BILA